MRRQVSGRKNHPSWGLRRSGLRLLSVMGSLCALVLFLAVSAPHRVHHIGHDDDQVNCPVWHATQHTPAEASLRGFSSPPLDAGAPPLFRALGGPLPRRVATLHPRAPPQCSAS